MQTIVWRKQITYDLLKVFVASIEDLSQHQRQYDREHFVLFFQSTATIPHISAETNTQAAPKHTTKVSVWLSNQRKASRISYMSGSHARAFVDLYNAIPTLNSFCYLE